MSQTYSKKNRELKRAEMKLKLNEIRERSKQMLKRHNWRKYFEEVYTTQTFNSSSGCSSMTTNQLYQHTNQPRFNKLLSAIEIDLSSNNEEDEETSADSCINMLHPSHPSNISKIVFDASTILSKKESKMFQTPIRASHQKPTKLCSTLFNIKKKIYFTEEDDLAFDKEVSYYFNRKPDESSSKRIKLTKKNDSFTFIADLASTSTPTRVSQAPITSTPKQISHNPFKYHPTQTIRNKTIKKKLKQHKVKSVNDCSNCRNALIQIKKKTFKKVKNTSLLSASIASCETCLFKQKIKLNKFTNVTKRVKPVTSTQLQPINNFEINLTDLLYTPSKLRELVNQSANKSIKTSVAVKSAPVISSATVAALAKVYYL